MENENIYEETTVDTFNTSTDDNFLDNSVEETETLTKVDEVDVVDSVLHLLEERLKEDIEENKDEGEVLLSSSETEDLKSSEPILVTNDNEIDYTDLLSSIDSKLDTIIENQETLIEYNKPIDLTTTLDEMHFDTFVLISALVVAFGFACSKIIKSLVFKL